MRRTDKVFPILMGTTVQFSQLGTAYFTTILLGSVYFTSLYFSLVQFSRDQLRSGDVSSVQYSPVQSGAVQYLNSNFLINQAAKIKIAFRHLIR